MIASIRIWAGCKLISFALWLMPPAYRSQRFVGNAMRTGHIKGGDKCP
jgi:hypothetical protein